jgi:insulysin
MRFMQPHGQAHYEINHILSHGTWHLTECLDVLPSIDAQAFTDFFPRLLSRTFVEALIGGNVTRGEATSLLESVESTLSVGSLVNIRAPCFSQLPERRIMCLEAGSEWLYPTAGFNPDDENSAVGIFFQVL